VVREARDAAQVAATERGITLDARVSDAPRVRGEKFLLVQAVGNLVQNAIEFSPPGAKVTLALRVAAGRATVTVEDSGAGVPDYARDKIFDRFYSLPRPDTGRKSSGIGLSIVREVARLHGGDATLQNRPEGGARATLTLPLG
jgi:two-component system sensor histidine kinase CreC